MPITVEWQNEERRIVLWRFFGLWTWREYFLTIEDLKSLTGDHHGRFDIIVDMLESDHLPVNVFQNVRRGTPPEEDKANRWGITVIVSQDAFVRVMMTALRALSPYFRRKYQLSDTVTAAHAIILTDRNDSS